ncbi:copper transporter [Actinoalloteichus sp. GBA129-24]|uniref:copper transporter n=1 Tax=Actinoalloteichus sp. GBA129-24 TaxID=1612551 RepID=UPI0009504754|nr:copper transporter [Actinoalloteichus sp. GBA129-24]APU22390.1 putative DUF3186 family protein [Actinoalloteichus sp. GBA129-24]
MITLRYHLVAMASVFLALAVGVVLGSTAVADRLLAGIGSDGPSSAEQIATLQTERDDLAARLGDAEAFTAAVGGQTVAGALDGQSVALVSTVEADAADRDAIRELIGAAGGTVSGEIQLTDGFTDPARADQLRDLVRGVLPAGAQLPAAVDPGTLAGGLLGALLSTDPETDEPQASAEESAAALGGLVDGGFVQAGGDVEPGRLVLVLDGGVSAANAAGDRAAVVARLAAQLDRSGAGAVLAGRAGSATGTGSVGLVRADRAVTGSLSTVDEVDRAAGRIAVILALREQNEGAAGQYGVAEGAQGPAPDAQAPAGGAPPEPESAAEGRDAAAVDDDVPAGAGGG